MFKIAMGSEVTDKVTGFKGIVTARHEYISGCLQCDVTPSQLSKDGNVGEITTFDEDRLKASKKKPISLKEKTAKTRTKNPGGPQPISRRV